MTVENALYLDHRLIDVAVFATPDAKLGELVAYGPIPPFTYPPSDCH